jgi:hypothetical protein
MNSSYTIQSSTITSKYTDLLLLLKSSNNKFIDSYFPPPHPPSTPWKRFSTKNEQPKPQLTKLSKFCKTLKSIVKNYN